MCTDFLDRRHHCYVLTPCDAHLNWPPGCIWHLRHWVCTIAWFFVYLKVPETKGMPLEVITQFFAVGAKQGADVTNDQVTQPGA